MEVVIIDNSLEKFIKSLEGPAIVKTLHTVELLESFGHKLGMPYSKSVGDGVFELRVRGEQEVRILYVFHNKKAVLLHGFVKKGMKIPKKELDLAIKKKKLLD